MSIDRKHSKSGIASVAIALGFPMMLITVFVISMILEGRVDYHLVRRLDLFLGLVAIIGGPIMHLTGLVFGIVGAAQSERKKLFSVLGITLNGGLLLLAVIFTVLFLAIIIAALGGVH